MDRRGKVWAWRLAKLLLAVAILWGVGRQFYLDLTRPAEPGQPELGTLDLHFGWLAASGGLYLCGIGFAAWYWYRLLQIFGDRPALFRTFRAYFIGHLGKYVPGKAWALWLRGGLVRGPDVRIGVAIITAFYEVLTTMATGALIAALVFLFEPPQVAGLDWHPLLTGLLLLGLCGLPLLPVVFNFLTERTAARFPQAEALQLPRLRLMNLAEGILTIAVGWGILGISIWALLQGVLPEPPALTPWAWGQICAAIGIAYVVGFLAFMLPSGVGVREYFLLSLLGFAGPEKWIVVAVLLLRLVWTLAEVVLAAILFFVGGGATGSVNLNSLDQIPAAEK